MKLICALFLMVFSLADRNQSGIKHTPEFEKNGVGNTSLNIQKLCSGNTTVSDKQDTGNARATDWQDENSSFNLKLDGPENIDSVNSFSNTDFHHPMESAQMSHLEDLTKIAHKKDSFIFVGKQLIFQSENGSIEFSPKFVILYSKQDPNVAMRPGGIENVQYNVPTWEGSINNQDQIAAITKNDSQSGDGFDDSILTGQVKKRTANIFASGETFYPEIDVKKSIENGWEVRYKKNKYGQLKATFKLTDNWPIISFEFIPAREGYYSVGYVGAEEQHLKDVEEIWQPLIWQEMRFPTQSFMTMAFMCPLPGTLVAKKNISYGVFAHPDEFPFSPLPVMNNSRFGVVVRNEKGKAQPMLFAPVLGGLDSKMEVGAVYTFRLNVWAGNKHITDAYREVAEKIFEFRNYRKNDISSLNTTLNNISSYSLSKYSWYIDSLKGCAYSTDVPGAVKNVSSLNPLELAIVFDNAKMFNERAYPIMEYMLSREKFLFSLDAEQKIQQPSRKMKGPCAPLTELTAIYNITGRSNPFLLELAKEEYNSSRMRNLEVKENGKNWKNALSIYNATGEKKYLKDAIELADEYISNRVTKRQDTFNEPGSQGAFFWTGFTNDWISLIELYEVTRDKKYLKAAHDGANHYAMFCWMSPLVPKDDIKVNIGGKAPFYWYLKSKGHQQMEAPEEMAPAWRLSEIGLTPESSGTSAGHRAIFMANYAPWMLRLGYYTNDTFLKNIAKSAVVGRYRNFPGYHMNTGRTTIYEKEDYPLREHKQLSFNSFHYNHILPKASMLLDYLVTDVFVRSKSAITFPSEFIEGYAYLQSKFYGHREGSFYGKKAWLWMPDDLLKSSSVELNYISARSEHSLMLAFANQSDKEEKALITLNDKIPGLKSGGKHKVTVWINNVKRDMEMLEGNSIYVKVPANGLTAIEIEGVRIETEIQEKLNTPVTTWKNGYAASKTGDARIMIINAGSYATKAFVYLRDDDLKYKEISLLVKRDNKEIVQLNDKHFPFEFTMDVNNDQGISFKIIGITNTGHTDNGEWIRLSKE